MLYRFRSHLASLSARKKMSQNLSAQGEVKRTYWVLNLDNVHGPLVPVYDSDIGGIPNQIYLE